MNGSATLSDEALEVMRPDLAGNGIVSSVLSSCEHAVDITDDHLLSTQKRQLSILVNVRSERSWKTEML